MAGGWAAALRGRAAATEAAIGDSALLPSPTAEGVGAEAFRRAAVAGGGDRISAGVFWLLHFLES